MPKMFADPDAIAEDIIRDVGTNLVVGLPLGLGKANRIINALYARAAADSGINLTFFSALTLEKPRPSNLLERRFITPVIDRLFGGYPDLAYADALHAGALPPNIQVIEFFFLAGKWLHVPFAQQHYISANYTHASSYLLARGLSTVKLAEKDIKTVNTSDADIVAAAKSPEATPSTAWPWVRLGKKPSRTSAGAAAAVLPAQPAMRWPAAWAAASVCTDTATIAPSQTTPR